jgi:hypothetical protein
MNGSAASTTPISLMRRFGLIVAVAMLFAFVTLSWAYLASPVLLDHVEPQMASISWYFCHGHPLFHDPDGGELYMMPYGPFAYALNGLVESSLGGSIFSGKLAGVVAINFALLAVYGLFRKYASRSTAFIATGFVAAYWIGTCYLSLSDRPDSFLILFVIVGLWASMLPSWTGAMLLGLSLGICLNLKIHSPLYFLPLACFALRAGMGWVRLFACGALALLLFLLPFLVVPNLSWNNFLWELSTTAHEGYSADLFGKNLLWLGLALAPFLALVGCSLVNNAATTRGILRQHGLSLASVLIAAGLLALLGSKNGSGPPHLMPYVAVVVFFGLHLWRSGLDASWRSSGRFMAAGAVVLCCLLATFSYGYVKIYQAFRVLNGASATEAKSVETDILDILQRRGTDHLLLMGVGDKKSYPQTYLRELLVFHGMPMGITVVPIMDWKQAGVAHPDLDRMREALAQSHPGKGIIWLIPKGTIPFSFVFNAEFRATFAKEYALRESTPYFDLYFERPATP